MGKKKKKRRRKEEEEEEKKKKIKEKKRKEKKRKEKKWVGDIPEFTDLGIAPAVVYLTQNHVNPYPPLIAGALLTHKAYNHGDWIVSFSGCKIHSSQEVCNAMMVNYFSLFHGKEVENM